MKAEERKTLEQNDLAAGLEKTLEAAGKGPPRAVVLVVILAVVLAVLFFVWRWLAGRAADYSSNQLVALSQMTDGSDIRNLSSLVDAKSLEALPSVNSPSLRRERLMLQQLEKFVAANPRSIEGRMARLRLARLALFLGEREGTNNIPAFRESTRADLELARDQYKQLAVECADMPWLQQEAILNQARAMESLGQFQEATALYEQLSKNPDTNSPSVIQAKKQFERLSKNLDTAEGLYKETLGSKTP